MVPKDVTIVSITTELSHELRTKVQNCVDKMNHSYTRAVGESVRLVCGNPITDAVLNAIPESVLAWTFNEEPMVMDPSRVLYQKGNMDITDLTPSDTGVYACLIQWGTEILKENITTGIFSLQVTTDSPTRIVFEMEEMKLECHSGTLGRLFPSATRQWLYNGTVVSSPSPTMANSKTHDVVDSVTKTMAGIWQCEVDHARTDRTWTTAWYRIEVEDPPSTASRWYRNMEDHWGIVVLISAILISIAIALFAFSAFKVKKQEDGTEKEFLAQRNGWEQTLSKHAENGKIDADAISPQPVEDEIEIDEDKGEINEGNEDDDDDEEESEEGEISANEHEDMSSEEKADKSEEDSEKEESVNIENNTDDVNLENMEIASNESTPLTRKRGSLSSDNADEDFDKNFSKTQINNFNKDETNSKKYFTRNRRLKNKIRENRYRFIPDRQVQDWSKNKSDLDDDVITFSHTKHCHRVKPTRHLGHSEVSKELAFKWLLRHSKDVRKLNSMFDDRELTVSPENYFQPPQCSFVSETNTQDSISRQLTIPYGQKDETRVLQRSLPYHDIPHNPRSQTGLHLLNRHFQNPLQNQTDLMQMQILERRRSNNVPILNRNQSNIRSPKDETKSWKSWLQARIKSSTSRLLKSSGRKHSEIKYTSLPQFVDGELNEIDDSV